MSTTSPLDKRAGVNLYFAFTGFLIALVLAGVHREDTKPGASPAALYLVSEYILIGAASIAYVAYAVVGERLRSTLSVPVWLYDAPVLLWTAAFAWASWYLLASEHNRFVLVFALFAALVWQRLIPGMPTMRFVAILAVSVLTWSLSATIPFTPLKDWLVGASPATALSALSFACAFFLVLNALANPGVESININVRRVSVYLAATAVFAEAALRTDNLLSDWIPYHRAYFADVANLVRSGHWLLWDVPSQYGFLSTAAIAVTPGQNGWQSLYLLTALLLTGQATIMFNLLYYGRRSLYDFAFALLLPLATYFSAGVTRYPFDARLYPQDGLRFIWSILLVFIAFRMYVHRQNVHAVNGLRICGYFVWTMSILWSFETAIWGTIIWIGYVGTEWLVSIFSRSRVTVSLALQRLLVRAAPFVALPVVIGLALEAVYHTALGHGPDYASYVEFSSIYAADPNFHVLIDRHGPAWTILLILGATGTLGIVAARTGRNHALPLIAAAWLATWITASYWVGEAFNNHVIAVYSVALITTAVMIFLSREWLDCNGAATVARMSVAPIAIVLIALLFGEPSRMLKIKAPLVPGWNFDSTRNFPPISGELASLVHRAGIKPSDRVAFPTSVGWIKLDLGFLLPFVKMPNGSLYQYQSWLPISPEGVYNTIESLPLDRQRVYIDRALDRFRGEAWYITYREPGGCALISPRLETTREVVSANFAASLCRLR